MGRLNRKISAFIISCVLIVCNGINSFAVKSLENEAFRSLKTTNDYGVA